MSERHESRALKIQQSLKKKPVRSVGVLLVHGIGENAPGFSAALTRQVAQRLASGMVGSRKHVEWLRWREVYWGAITRANQLSFASSADSVHPRRGRFNWEKTRNLVITGLGDAAAYQLVEDPSHQTYQAIQASLADGVAGLLDRRYPDRPLIIVAHSTGCQIASTYIHDTLKRSADPETSSEHGPGRRVIFSRDPVIAEKERAFLELRTLSGFITLGSNLPMFSFGLDRDDIRPISFPEPAIPALAGKQKWLNYFYRADVLGYPLKPISPRYAEAVNEDIELTRRFRLPGPIPPIGLHRAYWRDRRVAEGLTDMILNLMTSQAPPGSQ